jgi:hypothetical protein
VAVLGAFFPLETWMDPIHPSTITFFAPAALAKSSSVTSRKLCWAMSSTVIGSKYASHPSWPNHNIRSLEYTKLANGIVVANRKSVKIRTTRKTQSALIKDRSGLHFQALEPSDLRSEA